MRPSRPPGITALAIILEVFAICWGYLGLRGVGASSLMPTSTALLFLVNSAVSAALAVGLHRMRSWSHSVARIWSASAALLLFWFFLGPDHGLPVPLLAILPFGSALLGFSWFLEVYVPGALESAA